MVVVLCLAACLPILSAADAPNAVPTAEKKVQLAPYAVKGTPLNSYAFDLQVYTDKKTHKVARIFIVRVGDGSDAQKAGLEAGDEIVRIDGTAITEFDPQIGPESRLGQLLVNRRKGDEIDLEVILHRKSKVTLRALPPVAGLDD